MGKVKGIVLIAAGALVLAAGISGFLSSPETVGQIESAVYLEGGTLLPENEGKLVVVSGKLEGELPLVDSVTGVQLPCLRAQRIVEVYEASKTEGEETTWDWERVGYDYSEGGNNGINTPELVSSALVAPTKLGDFTVPESYLLQVSSPKLYQDYDPAALEEYGWNLVQDIYLSDSQTLPGKQTLEKKWGSAAGAGTVRISYQVVSPDDPLLYTCIGIQRGDTLVKAEGLDILPMVQGEKTIDDLVDANEYTSSALIISVILAAVLVLLGVRSLKKTAKGNPRQKQNP